MGQFKFSELRNFAAGDFAIQNGRLFYKEKEIAATEHLLIDSSEEVFFLFKITDEQVQKEFKYVIFLNYYRCNFYCCNSYRRTGEQLNFTTSDGQKFSFKRYCYNNNICSSKIIGGHCR